jgi:ligand-binding sensor domain-containing protein
MAGSTAVAGRSTRNPKLLNYTRYRELGEIFPKLNILEAKNDVAQQFVDETIIFSDQAKSTLMQTVTEYGTRLRTVDTSVQSAKNSLHGMVLATLYNPNRVSGGEEGGEDGPGTGEEETTKVSDKSISSYYKKDNTFFFGTINHGIAIGEDPLGENFSFIGSAQGVSNNINCALADGSYLFFGTNYGLVKMDLSDRSFSIKYRSDGLASALVKFLVKMDDGRLLAFSDNTISVSTSSGSTFGDLDEDKFFHNKSITMVKKIPGDGDKLYVGTSNGLYHYDTVTKEAVKEAEIEASLFSTLILSMDYDTVNDILFIGTDIGVLRVTNFKSALLSEYRLITSNDGFAANSCFDVVTRGGKTLVATSRGIGLVLANGAVKHLSKSGGLVNYSCVKIYPEADDLSRITVLHSMGLTYNLDISSFLGV